MRALVTIKKRVAVWARVALAMLSIPVVAAAASPPAPVPPSQAPTRFVFAEDCKTAPTEVMGDTPAGRRQRVRILGGTFSGPGIRGTILDEGADTQLIRADGSMVIDARYMLRTDDGAMIQIHNVGVIAPPGTGPRKRVSWAAPTFEAPIGRYSWLNDGLFVSSVTPNFDPRDPRVAIRVFQVGD